MRKKPVKFFFLFTLMGTLSAISGVAQSDSMRIVPTHNTGEVYNIKPAIDIPLTIVTDAWSLYGMNKIYSRDPTPQSVVDALRWQDINSFDRPVWDNYDEKAKDASDMFFYGSMPLPLLLMFDKEIRKDGLKVGLLWLQAMGITGTLYTSGAMAVSRYRPYVYNKDAPIDRTRGGGRNSFPAGHPGLVATSTFFMAKVISDYHPDMKGKWALYTVAAGAAVATGALRVKAGQHFKTDVITGITIGTLSGILVPHFHKIRKKEDPRVVYMPNIQPESNGFTILYRLGK